MPAEAPRTAQEALIANQLRSLKPTADTLTRYLNGANPDGSIIGVDSIGPLLQVEDPLALNEHSRLRHYATTLFEKEHIDQEGSIQTNASPWIAWKDGGMSEPSEAVRVSVHRHLSAGDQELGEPVLVVETRAEFGDDTGTVITGAIVFKRDDESSPSRAQLVDIDYDHQVPSNVGPGSPKFGELLRKFNRVKQALIEERMEHGSQQRPTAHN